MRRLLIPLICLLLVLPACKFLQLSPMPPAATAVVAENTAPVPNPTKTTGKQPAVTASAPVANPGAQEIADYEIDVHLDPRARRLTGEQTILYRNTMREPITQLVFHLYLNAFKNQDTIFMQESGGQLRGYAFNPESAGWIEVTNLRLADGRALTLELLEDGTLARALLPEPVLAGEELRVVMSFRSQLPEIFARTGWVLDERGDPFFLVAQWFPKLAVWTDEGWVGDAFHGNAEFFADFGRYQVAITLPENYAHGATGMLIKAQDNPDGTQTAVYQASGVIDFAWVTSPNLKSQRLQAGAVELVYLYLPEHAWSVERVLSAAKKSLELFSSWFGPYPYARLTITDVPEEGSGAGGMEYPTFIAVGADTSRNNRSGQGPGWTDFLEVVTVHEMAHQWWQSMVATNEAREPWLDEGFADYATIRYFTAVYGLDIKGPDRDLIPAFLSGRRSSFLRNPDLPIYGTAWDMPYNEYVIAAYSKPDMALMTLEGQLGEEKMLELMQTYFERYRFKHPTSADFRAVAQEVSGEPLDWFFEGLVYGDGTINWVAESIAGDTVTIAREGSLALPAEVMVTFSGGAQQMEICQAEKKICTLEFPGQSIEAVMVDPDRKLMVELDWTDNQLP